jgi:hypothetical protein
MPTELQTHEHGEYVGLRVIRPQTTGGFWYNWYEAVKARERYFPPTIPEGPTTFMIDLTATYPTPAVLLAFIFPVAQRIKAKDGGRSTLVIITNDPATRIFVESLASANSLPIFVSSSPEAAASTNDLQEAQAVGDITPTDEQTLEIFAKSGGELTASEFAVLAKLKPTAATNRLVTLSRKGYLRRVQRPGRDGDLFVDPRRAKLQTIRSSIQHSFPTADIDQMLLEIESGYKSRPE